MRAVATAGLLLLIASASAAAQKVAPRQAALEFFIINLRNVDSVAETFEVDYYLNTIWDEPGMQSEPADWATVWNPSTGRCCRSSSSRRSTAQTR